MSFASEMKKELTLLVVHKEHARAELSALIRMNGLLSLKEHQFILNVPTENASIARRIFSLLKETYDVHAEVLVRKKMNLKKNNVYIVRLKQGTLKVLADLKILDNMMFITNVSGDIKGNAQKMKSYLRGAFLAGGSVNNPEISRYHLEIHSTYEDHNQDICEMMNYYGMNASILARKNGYISYLKNSEKITDFLTLLGATNSRFKFEDVLIMRDFRNSVNRLQNAELANLNKTVDAAYRQIENIKLIESMQGLKNLPPKLMELAQMRLKHPDISLKELGEILPSGSILKSGINHRMRKINELAEKIRHESRVNNDEKSNFIN
ncbi:MAG: DNA-binding protein WhiA [Lactobacillales bacterium]|jgi:DNA-binding protein WhiA|nr:DNA-binding protein WhiA [Lactobacillales bacterium]